MSVGATSHCKRWETRTRNGKQTAEGGVISSGWREPLNSLTVFLKLKTLDPWFGGGPCRNRSRGSELSLLALHSKDLLCCPSRGPRGQGAPVGAKQRSPLEDGTCQSPGQHQLEIRPGKPAGPR